MEYTTCMTCDTRCKPSELDINSECLMCQAKFGIRMKNVVKNMDYGRTSQSYYSTIPIEHRPNLMNDAMNLYKIRFKNKDLLIDYLNKKYNLTLTRNIFNSITSPKHLEKLSLTWRFELQKTRRKNG